MELSVSSASTPSLAPAELILAASRFGYRGIEWRVADVDSLTPSSPWHFRDNNRCTIAPRRDAIHGILHQCEDAGLGIVSLSPYLDIGAVDPAEEMIAWSGEIGVRCLRVWAPSTTRHGSYLAALERFQRWIDDLTPALRHHGVRLGLEIHQRTACPSASMAMRVIDSLDPAVIGVIYDIGNLAIEGWENVALALELMGPRLAHVQIKNASWSPRGTAQGWDWSWCPIEDGLLPLPAIVSDLVAAGYAGWLSAEDFSTHHGDIDKLRRNHHWLSQWVADAMSLTRRIPSHETER